MSPDEIIERFIAKCSPFKILLAVLFLVMAAVEFSNGVLEVYDFLIPALSCLLINELYLQGTGQYEEYLSKQNKDKKLRMFTNISIGVLLLGSTMYYAFSWDPTNFFRVGAIIWGSLLLMDTRKRYANKFSYLKIIYFQLGSFAILASFIDFF